MLRTSRRGLADLVVMIVLIVFLLGMGTLAFFAYDKSQAERNYLARLKDLPVRQAAERDATRAQYAQLSELIGFKGEGNYSSHQQIRELLRHGSAFTPAFYRLNVEDASVKGSVQDTRRETRKFESGGQSSEVTTGAVKQTALNDKKIFEHRNDFNLYRAISAVDLVINELAGTHVPRLQAARESQRKLRDEAAVRTREGVSKAVSTVDTAIETANRTLAEANNTLASQETALAQGMRREYEAYAGLDSPEMRQAREDAFAKLRDTATARAKAALMQANYRRRADSRRYDDSRDPDGSIFLVSRASGYVWIDIGQKQDVRLNQTFQVIRAEAGSVGYQQVAEIRVVEVMQGNVARCRVDQLDEDGIYPEQGDLIRNPNFSSRQYHTFAFAGKFGGSNSRHTQQELKDMLLALGFRVVSRIDGATDAVIVGGDWESDPIYAEAKVTDLGLETYTEQELLYWLRLSGPDPKNG